MYHVHGLLWHELTSGHPADNVELGTACGKLHRVSVLAITDPGALVVASAATSVERSQTCCHPRLHAIYIRGCYCFPAQATRTLSRASRERRLHRCPVLHCAL